MRFEIDTDALGRDIGELRIQLQSLKKELADLNTGMEALNSTWEGAAKEAYLLQYHSDQQNMEQLCKTLESFIKTLDYAKSQYMNSNNQARQAVLQIQV